jgi:hypothetical protein
MIRIVPSATANMEKHPVIHLPIRVVASVTCRRIIL